MLNDYLPDVTCPSCFLTNTIKNGSVNGKSKRQCQDCGRQYTPGKDQREIYPWEWEIVERLACEGLEIASIARAMKIGETTVQEHLNAYYRGQQEPQCPPATGEKKSQ